MSERRIRMFTRKAWTLVDAGQHELAGEQMKQAIGLDPDDDGLELEFGVMMFKAERFETALERFSKAVEKNRANVTAYVNGTKTLLKLSRAEEGLGFAVRGLEAASEHASLLLAAGLCELELSRAETALERFARACELRPRDGEPWLKRSVALRSLGRVEEALQAIAESCAVQPGRPEALHERARCNRALGKLEHAWENMIDAIKIRGGDAADRQLLLDAAEVAIEMNLSREAGKLAQKLVDRNKDDGEAWIIKGRARERLGEVIEGATNVGTGHMILGDYERALGEFERALELGPKFLAAWCNRGVTLERMGRLDDALKCYDLALAENPKAAVVWHNRGMLLWGPLARKEDAIACFREEVKIDHRRFFQLPSEIRRLLDEE